MTCKIVAFLFCTLSLLSSTYLIAQDKSPRDRLFAAHAQYYSPTVSGLKSFHCDAAIDWKALLARFTGKEIPDDNAWLKYLRTVQLSVDDELRGRGSLAWVSTSNPPAGLEGAEKQTQEGLQASLGGFFQSWNAFMNGSMVPLPDSTVAVTKSGEGVHLSGASKDAKFDEDYDKNMLLTQVVVDSPQMKVLSIPAYVGTSDGLVVSTVTSRVNQPPSAPETEAIFRIDYAKVDAFQIPSRIVLDIKNTGVIDIGLGNCKVAFADWAKK